MHHLLHHANCADGFAAACIARHALLTQGIPETDINVQPVNYGQPEQMPLRKNGILFPGDTITYLDYTPPQETLDAFYAEHGGSMIHLTIIDHHSTAAERHGRDKVTGLPLERSADVFIRFNVGPLENLHHSTTPQLPFVSVFNLKLSGATLAWIHFMNTQEERAPDLPRAIELIEWRDHGHAFDPINAEDPRTADSLNFHAYLFRCLPRTFGAWTPLLLENPASSIQHLAAAIQTGSRLRTIDACIIAAAVNGPHWLNFHGEEIPAVNGLDAGLISDACTELLRAYPTAPFAASWFIAPRTGHATYSLRSRRGSTVNVAEIAAAMAPGGGGHPNAAGFSTPIPVPFV